MLDTNPATCSLETLAMLAAQLECVCGADAQTGVELLCVCGAA